MLPTIQLSWVGVVPFFFFLPQVPNGKSTQLCCVGGSLSLGLMSQTDAKWGLFPFVFSATKQSLRFYGFELMTMMLLMMVVVVVMLMIVIISVMNADPRILFFLFQILKSLISAILVFMALVDLAFVVFSAFWSLSSLHYNLFFSASVRFNLWRWWNVDMLSWLDAFKRLILILFFDFIF